MKRYNEPGEALRLPDGCAVRLIDLESGVGGVLAVGEDGFVNIYINARLSHDARIEALRHELRHHYRGDLYSDADIRAVERLADGAARCDLEPLRRALAEACFMFDVLQTPPVLPVSALTRLAEGLNEGDIVPNAAACLCLCREVDGANSLRAALCFDEGGKMDSAVAIFEIGDAQITVDMRRRRGRLDIFSIAHERDGLWLQLY